MTLTYRKQLSNCCFGKKVCQNQI